jgi:hypothetical protein
LREIRKIGVADFSNSGAFEDRQIPTRLADFATIDEPHIDALLLRIDTKLLAGLKSSGFPAVTAMPPSNSRP